MKSDTTQQDLLVCSDANRASAYRIAADTALHDPYWSPEDRARRAAYYNSIADEFESRLPTREAAA